MSPDSIAIVIISIYFVIFVGLTCCLMLLPRLASLQGQHQEQAGIPQGNGDVGVAAGGEEVGAVGT